MPVNNAYRNLVIIIIVAVLLGRVICTGTHNDTLGDFGSILVQCLTLSILFADKIKA